ncbi:MAG: amidase, partial [Acidobacteriota bacterium]
MTAEATSSPPQAPWRLSAAAIAAQVAAGELSALEVCESCLVRVAEVEPGLGAFLEVLTDDARTQAAELDRRLAAGAAPGPLAGVPLAVKDNLAVAGHRLTCGSRILGDFVSPRDAAAVSRLRAAGAVVIGKTNLDEFAMGSSCERSAFHPTRNPWSPDRVPGGSSGGSAAAVASAVPLGL